MTPASRTRCLVIALLFTLGICLWSVQSLRLERERLAELTAELEQARASAAEDRQMLSHRIQELKDLLKAKDDVRAAYASTSTASPAPSMQWPQARQSTSESVGTIASAARPIMSPFDVERLIEAGFSRVEVERYRDAVGEIEMRRLKLRDQAQREGWIDTPRFARETRAIYEQLEGVRQLNKPLYDWVLYSSGHPNRVSVSEITPRSPAEMAGLREGDIILKYDDGPVLTPDEVLAATQEGQPGESVTVLVQRVGEAEPRSLYLPRGPIGVTLIPAAVEPSAIR